MGAKGGLELRSRWDLQQPQGLAAVSRAEWQVAPNQHIRGPERLGLVPLLGEGGSRAKEQAPDSQWPTQGGRSQPLRAREGHGAAVREKRQALLEQQAWLPRPRRKAVGLERQGATRGAGRAHPRWSLLERNQGKRVPSVESSGGRCPDPPHLGRGVSGKELLAAAGEVRRPEGREEKTAGGAEAAGQRGHSPAPGLEGTCMHQSPKAKVSERPAARGQWAGGAGREPHPRRRRAAPLQGQVADRARVCLQELLKTNRKLKEHLSLHLEPRLGRGQNRREGQGFPETQECRGETQREKKTTYSAALGPARRAPQSSGGGRPPDSI